MALIFVVHNRSSFDPICNNQMRMSNAYQLYPDDPNSPVNTYQCCDCDGYQGGPCINCLLCLEPVVPQETLYLIPGTYTFVTPQAGTYVFEYWGAGGGGGGGSGSNGSADGGAGGGYGKKTLVLGAGVSVTIVVGAKGAGGITNGNGVNGGASTVTYAPLSFAGVANGGNGGARAQDSGSNAPGGTATGGDVNTTGSVGGAVPNSSNGGVGGNGAGPGGGLGGSGGIGGTTAATVGAQPGGGGGGGGSNSGTIGNGRAGGDGKVKVTWS